jgi:ubiquinone/menaquinone biosynthesis C-methylase UbiE
LWQGRAMPRQWIDSSYLKTNQYLDSNNLNARSSLHQKYGSAHVSWVPWLHSLLPWSTVEEVLEIGSGPGSFWKDFPTEDAQHIQLTISDLSSSMVAEARQRIGTEAFRFTSAVCADLHELPFETSSFDVVVANHVLYHSTDIDGAIDEVRRVLRSDGYLLAATNGPLNFCELKAVKKSVFGDVDDGDIANFDSESGVEALQRAFENVTWHQYEDELRCTEVEDVIGYITSSPPGETATPSQIDQLRALIVGSMKRGEFVITKDTGAFVAWD